MKTVMLNDKNKTYEQALEYYDEADVWALENCASYDGNEVVDVADFSYEYDVLAEYTFKNEEDAVMFLLRWK
jgi:hypothetical protein